MDLMCVSSSSPCPNVSTVKVSPHSEHLYIEYFSERLIKLFAYLFERIVLSLQDFILKSQALRYVSCKIVI